MKYNMHSTMNNKIKYTSSLTSYLIKDLIYVLTKHFQTRKYWKTSPRICIKCHIVIILNNLNTLNKINHKIKKPIQVSLYADDVNYCRDNIFQNTRHLLQTAKTALQNSQKTLDLNFLTFY